MSVHNSAKKDQIAKVVLMPGDPLRAKYIAENFLKDYQLVNDVRNMYAYTGKFKDTTVTIMAHGMGNPSIGIYSYELFKDYDVDMIIRIGSCGAYLEDLKLLDLIIATSSISSSPYAYNLGLVDKHDCDTLVASEQLTKTYKEILDQFHIPYKEGMVYASDAFYGTKNVAEIQKLIDDKKILAAEMESFALYANAKYFNKQALTILTVSDSIINHQEIDAMARQTGFNAMICTALELACRCTKK